MKKTIFLFCLVVSLIRPTAGKAIELNGTDWSIFSKDFKLGFIMGWVYAGDEGFINVEFLHHVLSKVGPSAEQGLAKDDKWLLNNALTENSPEKFKKKGIKFDNVSFGQILETIDQIYSDPRVKLWGIAEIMPLVRGRLKGGWTTKELDEVISYQIKRKASWNRFRSGNLSDEERKKAFFEYETLKPPKVLE